MPTRLEKHYLIRFCNEPCKRLPSEIRYRFLECWLRAIHEGIYECHLLVLEVSCPGDLKKGLLASRANRAICVNDFNEDDERLRRAKVYEKNVGQSILLKHHPCSPLSCHSH